MHLMIRENVGHDFGGWNSVLFMNSDFEINGATRERLENGSTVFKGKRIHCDIPNDSDFLYQKFDRFVFLNSTVSGPYPQVMCLRIGWTVLLVNWSIR